MSFSSPRTVQAGVHPVVLSRELKDVLPLLSERVGSRPLFVCTEERLPAVLPELFEGIAGAVPSSVLVSFPGGEENKARAAKARLEDTLLEKGAGRDSLLAAVGGGVVTDLVGFVAATYLRGIPFLGFPTTLLGMVDAALGGKTGVNTPAGKNLLGRIHFPEEVFCVLEALQTLPWEEFACGLAECLKHGLIRDAAYFRWIAGTSYAALRNDPDKCARLVETSVRIKCDVADRDSFEKTGHRNILNVGHTVAHAIETLSGYGVGHGEAVGVGLCWEAALATEQGFLSPNALAEIVGAFEPLRRGLSWETFPPEEVFRAAGKDKKNKRGEVVYVPLESPGSVALPPPHTAAFTAAELRAARERLRRGPWN